MRFFIVILITGIITGVLALVDTRPLDPKEEVNSNFQKTSVSRLGGVCSWSLR